MGLCPVAVLQRIGRTYKKWTISQYSTSATDRIQDTINRIQDTKLRKTTAYTDTTKQKQKEKATAGN
jgi:hypothetical protein